MLAAVAVTVPVLVDGCTQDTGPKPSPLPSTTKSASPTSTAPTPPVMPAEAKGTSAKSAKAFARHYVDLINFSSKSGDTATLDAASDPACESCAAISKNIRDIYDAGGSITSHGWKLRSATLVPQQPKSRPILDLGIIQAPERVVRASGQAPKRFPGGKQPMTMHLIMRQNAWVVARLDLVT